MVLHQRFIRRVGRLLSACLLLPLVASADSKPKEWNPAIIPGNFVVVVDNPYFPLPVGRTWVYRGQTKEGMETLEVEVTGQTRNVMGVNTMVVIERSTVNGQLVEVSQNYFAQDNQGTVWYFGEATQEYVNGVPGSTAGSWEAGIAGAKPGIIMEANPQNGDSYFQESAPGVAEDMAQVMSTFRRVTVPAGTYMSVLQTKEFTPIETGANEFKSYAQGVGLILEEKGNEKLELISVQG